MTTQESADHWNKLADDELRWASYEEGRGHYGGVHRNRAEMFRKTARSLQLEIETGKPHCTVCVGPHLNQHCPQAPHNRSRHGT
jgi:hypothetical protein